MSTAVIDSRWRGINWLVTLHLSVDLLLMLLPMPNPSGRAVLVDVLFGLVVSQVLLSSWLAVLLEGPLVPRLITSLGLSVLAWLIPVAGDYVPTVRDPAERHVVPSYLLTFTIYWVASVLSSLTVYRFRKHYLWHRSVAGVEAVSTNRQFGIRHVLLLTTIVAVVALLIQKSAVVEWHYPAWDMVSWAILSLCIAGWLLPLASLMLRTDCPAHIRILVGGWALTAPAMILRVAAWMIGRGSLEFAIQLMGRWLTVALLSTALTLWALRRFGWRLQTRDVGCDQHVTQ